jgi:hypothetical protein
VIERKAGVELPDIIEIKKGKGHISLFEPNLKGKINLKPKKVATRSLLIPQTPSKRGLVIFENRVLGVDNLFKLHAFCKSFGKVGEPICRFIPEPADKE